MKKVSAERKELLNLGLVEPTNLIESLSIDFKILLGNVLPKFKFPELEKSGITK